ncbi:efflux RND transporter periplasmic adaptor subunit, partial [Bacteroidota bacterium]
LTVDFPEDVKKFNNFFSSIDINKKIPEFPEVTSEKLKIFLSTRNVLSEYYDIQKDELQLSRHTVKAPFDGTYTEVFLEEGAYINTGGRIARAIRTDMLELEVPLEKFDAQWVNIGDKVEVLSKSRSLKWEGKVIRKNQFVDPNTQSQGVFIRIQNDKEKPLLVGEYLQAHFPGHPIDNVMEIPMNAVFNSDEVFIINDGRLHKRVINIIKVNQNSLLFNGLKDSEIVVVQPLINVMEGTHVITREEMKVQNKNNPDKKTDDNQQSK